MTRLGYQIPNFTYPGGGPADLFPTVVRQARAAEASGFDTVLVMDHFYQLPGLGRSRERNARVLHPPVGVGPAHRAGRGSPLWSRATPTATPPCWPRK